MRKINALFFIFALFATPAAYAWDASALRDAWGAPVGGLSTCGHLDLGGEDNDDAAIGPQDDITYCAIDDSDDFAEDHGSECEIGGNWFKRGFSMLIARELNENGAYFCPTIIGGDKKRWELSRTGWNQPYWTIYKEVAVVDVNSCFWVCKAGFYGDGCQQTTSTTCNLQTISKENWSNDAFAIRKASRDVESEVAMFYQSVKDACGNKCRSVTCSPYEHDMVLGVVGWLPGKHGVKAQPFVIRGGFDPGAVTRYAEGGYTRSGIFKGWNYGPGRVVAYAVGTPTLLCRNGYEPNFTNTDCVPIDSDLCEVTEAANSGNTCGDKYGEFYDLDDFNAETMKLHFFESEPAYSSSGKHVATVHYNCWGILCTTPGYGFDPNVSRATCVDCGVSDPRNGVNWFGKCVRCDVGEIFDSATGTCLTTTALSRDRLYYGPGKDENTAIIEQCWVEPDMYSYSDCVWGVMSTATFRGLAQSQYIERIGGGSGGGDSGGGSGGGNNDEPQVVGGYRYEGPVGGGSGGGSGIKTMETGLDSNPHMY